MQNTAINEARKTLAKKSGRPVGVMFSTLLVKYLEKKEINLSTLFGFWLWPEYLQHYGKHMTNQFDSDLNLHDIHYTLLSCMPDCFM